MASFTLTHALPCTASTNGRDAMLVPGIKRPCISSEGINPVDDKQLLARLALDIVSACHKGRCPSFVWIPFIIVTLGVFMHVSYFTRISTSLLKK
jgi:hypothetical protein